LGDIEHKNETPRVEKTQTGIPKYWLDRQPVVAGLQKQNIFWQRLRLYQAEREADALIALDREGAFVDKVSPKLKNQDLERIRANATFDLLEVLPRFVSSEPDHPSQRVDIDQAYSVVVSGILENIPDTDVEEMADLLGGYLTEEFDEPVTLHRSGTGPDQSRKTSPWYIHREDPALEE
jgi:hypothetical protein